MHFTKGVHEMSNKFSEDVIQALCAGGFVCLLPHVINPAWGGHAIRLAGFPITICFTGLSPKSGQDCQFPVVASCYKFDPSTHAALHTAATQPNLHGHHPGQAAA